MREGIREHSRTRLASANQLDDKFRSMIGTASAPAPLPLTLGGRPLGQSVLAAPRSPSPICRVLSASRRSFDIPRRPLPSAGARGRSADARATSPLRRVDSPPAASVAAPGCRAVPSALSAPSSYAARPPAKDDPAAQLRADWEEASGVIDHILRGPFDPAIQDPSSVKCRLCSHSLTGNLVADELAVANHRLVKAMDFAWVTCEQLYHKKAELQQRSLAKQREAEHLRKLAEGLRAEFPQQVHGLVMRTLTAQRERIAQLQEELSEVRVRQGAEDPWGLSDAGMLQAAPDGKSLPAELVDVEWRHFRETIDRQVGT